MNLVVNYRRDLVFDYLCQSRVEISLPLALANGLQGGKMALAKIIAVAKACAVLLLPLAKANGNEI